MKLRNFVVFYFSIIFLIFFNGNNIIWSYLYTKSREFNSFLHLKLCSTLPKKFNFKNRYVVSCAVPTFLKTIRVRCETSVEYAINVNLRTFTCVFSMHYQDVSVFLDDLNTVSWVWWATTTTVSLNTSRSSVNLLHL